MTNPLTHLESPRSPLYLLLLCLLCSLASYLFLQNRRLRQDPPAAATIGSALPEAAVAHHFEVTLAPLERTLDLSSELELINVDLGLAPALPPEGRYVVFAFSELTCNTCADEESRFANELADAFGGHRILAVVHSEQRRYALNYVRMNQARYPVFYDRPGAFLQANALQQAPMVLCIDDGRIAMCHLPLPGHQALCNPFHAFIRTFLGSAPNPPVR